MIGDDTQPGNRPLPNEKWIRSPLRADWAVCLDPEARHFGWKMFECNGAWVSGAEIGLKEARWVLKQQHLSALWPLMQPLIDKLQQEEPHA